MGGPGKGSGGLGELLCQRAHPIAGPGRLMDPSLHSGSRTELAGLRAGSAWAFLGDSGLLGIQGHGVLPASGLGPPHSAMAAGWGGSRSRGWGGCE